MHNARQSRVHARRASEMLAMPNRERDADEKAGGSGVASTGYPDVTATTPGVSTAPLRAVLDTSALVPSRMRRELQVAAQAGLYVGYWSPWIIAELNRVLTWRWIQRASPPDLSR